MILQVVLHKWQKLFCNLLLSLYQKVSRGLLKEKEKRKEKQERKKRLILLKNMYSRAKLVKLKVPVIIQDPDSSHIEVIV